MKLYPIHLWCLNFWKGHRSLSNRERTPRKLKKAVIGKRVSKTKLRKMIATTTITKQEYPKPAIIEPYPFCPHCGCDQSYVENHGVPYPEIWETEHCLRCHKEIGGADNSPYWHILEDMIEPVNLEIFD